MKITRHVNSEKNMSREILLVILTTGLERLAGKDNSVALQVRILTIKESRAAKSHCLPVLYRYEQGG